MKKKQIQQKSPKHQHDYTLIRGEREREREIINTPTDITRKYF